MSLLNRFCATLCFALLLLNTSLAQTVSVADTGILPDTYENATARIQKVIDDAIRTGNTALTFPKGRYDFWPDGATREKYFISNTSTEQEDSLKIRTIGMLFRNARNLTIDGNGALFADGRIKAVSRPNDRELLLTFEKPVPADLEEHDCVENMTWTPEVLIRGNYFTRTNTRGVLLATPREAVIENNTFFRTGMSAVLIEGEAKRLAEADF